MVCHDISKRKLRGQRRHYRWLKRWASEFRMNLEPGHWYDLWHDHPDIPGWTLLGPKHRKAHLKALFTAFDRVLEQVEPYEAPFQTFLSIPTKDLPLMALYFHTPNPNDDNFPYLFKNHRWDPRIPSWLANLVDQDRFQVGVSDFDGDVWYVVLPRGCRGYQVGGFS